MENLQKHGYEPAEVMKDQRVLEIYRKIKKSNAQTQKIGLTSTGRTQSSSHVASANYNANLIPRIMRQLNIMPSQTISTGPKTSP